MSKLKRVQRKKFSKYHKMIICEMMKDLKLRDKVWLWIFCDFFYSVYKIGYTNGFNRANEIIYLINNNRLNFSKNVKSKKYYLKATALVLH